MKKIIFRTEDLILNKNNIDLKIFSDERWKRAREICKTLVTKLLSKFSNIYILVDDDFLLKS